MQVFAIVAYSMARHSNSRGVHSILPFDTIKIAQLQLSYNPIGKRKANVVNLRKTASRGKGGGKGKSKEREREREV